MVAADTLTQKLASPEYAQQYADWRESMAGVDRADWAAHRLLPDPEHARVRVYATHSTHKSLSALRQASMIHIRDQDFDRLTREQFGEAFLTHTSTSPNQQLLASLDLARRQVDIEGFQMVRSAYTMALAFRKKVSTDPVISTWFHILDQADLVPEQFRTSGARSYQQDADGVLDGWNEAWQDDQFVLDPTRVTLYIGDTGMSGFEFREDVLMRKFGIQINKTSINSVLLIFTIGVTWSSVHYLLDALRRTAEQLTKTQDSAGPADRALHRRKIENLTLGLPALPNFSDFDSAFKADPRCPDGDMRAAFYAGYTETNREYIPLDAAQTLVDAGRPLVSANFVVPYPPGFPILVPGQVVSTDILDFLHRVDVKEIHGYRPELGLSVFTETARDYLELLRGNQADIQDTVADPAAPAPAPGQR